MASGARLRLAQSGGIFTFNRQVWPLKKDIRRLEARYGSSVSVYFIFAEWTVVTGLVNALLWTPLLGTQVAALISGHSPPTAAGSLLPAAVWEYFQFSAYRTNEALLYFLVVAIWVVWYVLVSFRNVSSILRRQIYSNIFEADTRKMKFTRSLFTSWDAAATTVDAAEEQKLSTLSNLRGPRAKRAPQQLGGLPWPLRPA